MKKLRALRPGYLVLALLLVVGLSFLFISRGVSPVGPQAHIAPAAAPQVSSVPTQAAGGGPAFATSLGTAIKPRDVHFSPEMRQLVAKLDRGEPVRLAIGEAAAKTYYTAPCRVTTDTFKISTGVATEMPSSYRVYTGYEFLPSGAKGDHLSIAVVNDAVAMSLITPTGEYRIERNELSGKLEALRLRDVAERGVDSAEENCRTLPNGAHVITYSAATAQQVPVSLPVTFDYSATAGVDLSLAAVDQSSPSTSTESVDHPYFRFGAQYDASLKDMTVIQVMAKAATGVGTASNLSSKAALAMSVAGTSADIWPRQLGLRYLMSELIMIASDSAEADPAPSTNPVPNPNPANTFYDLSYQQGVFVNWIKTHRPYSVYKQGHSSCFCVIPGGVAGLASGVGIYGSSDSSVTIEEKMGNFCVHNHEIGHCLGAPHSTGGLMNPSVSTYESLYAQVGTSSPLMTAAKYVYNYLSGTNLKGLSGPAPLRKADELPFGVGDTVTTALNTPVTFSPLTNDKTSVLGGSVNVLSLVEVGQVFPVAAGKAVVSGNTIIFTPATGFTGRAWFSYTLRGNVGNSGQGWLHNANVVVTVGGNATDPTLFPALDPQHDYIRTDFSVPVRLNPLLNDEAQGRLWAGDVDVLLSPADSTAESYSEKAFTLVGAVVQAGNGSVTLETRTLLSTINSVEKNTGYLVYTPGANEPSEVIIKYTVRDALGTTADAYIVLARSGFNYPPIAAPQSVSVAENTPRFITVEASDGEGAALTYSVVTPPSHGILSGTVPNLIYTPTTNYTGSDGFTFKANDGTQDSNIATVTLTVAPNSAPVATAMAISTDEDTATAFVLAGTDAENGTLTYAVLTQPAHGTLTGSAPNLTYTPASNYNGSDSFTFQVNDGYINSIPATVSINVIPVNDAPVAVLSVAHPIAATGATVNFDATASSDVDGTVAAYNINFCDGQSATTATAAHAYTSPGFYTATLTVTDNTLPEGATGTTTVGVTVVGADTIAADGLESGTTSGGIGWSGAWVLGTNASVSNAESPNSGVYHLRMLKAGSAVRTVDLSALAGSHPVLTFNWKANSLDTVGGIPETAKVEVYDGKWYTVLSVVNGQDTNVYQSATIDLSGYTLISNFQVRASIQGSAVDDYFYLDNIQIKSSTGTNVAPVTNSQNLATAEDTAKAISLTASDANGDALIYTIVTPPAHGTLTGTGPNLTYTPAANYTGSDSFDYTVTDPLMSIAKGTVSLTITPVNDAPVANNQSVVIALNAAALISLTASDVEVDALTYQIVAGVAHGTLSLSGRGVTYTPTTGYSGNDSFTFKVNDGQVDSNVATVDLTVVNGTALPVTAGLALWLDASQLTGVTNGQQVNTWTDMSGLANHALRQSTSSAGNPSLVTNVLNGKPVLRFVSNTSNTGDYLKFNRINTIRSVFWVVKETAALTDFHFLLGDSSTYDFHRQSSNGPLWHSTSANASVRAGVTKLMGTTINGTTTSLPSAQFQLISLVTTGNVQANQITQDRTFHGSWQGDIAEIIIYSSALSAADEAKVGAYLTTKYGLTTTYTAINQAPVANAQAVTALSGTANPITLTATDANNDSLTYSVVAQPAHGTLTGTAPALTYTPAAGYSGSDSFTFKANDGVVDSATATVSITVKANSASVAATQSVTTAEDTNKAIVLGATDADSDPLTYSIVTAPSHGTFTGTAPNLTYVPAAHYNGSDSFTFRVSDGYTVSNIATVNITVTAVNDTPVAVAQSVATFIQTPVSVLLAGTDVDGGALTYTVVAQPAHGTLSGTAPSLTYTPAGGFGGTDTFAFKVNDGVVDSSVATVTITVGTAVSYNFGNGLQGWTIQSQNTAGTGPQIMVSSTSERGLMTPPVLTTRSDTDGGLYNGNAAHPVLVARSPSFTIATGALITFESAGGSSVDAEAPALGSGAYNPNALGVSLVNAATGVRVLSIKTANELAKSTYTLDPSALANDGNSYYLEVVDHYSGNWGYGEWDNFTIQASAPLPQLAITATDATATEGTPATDIGTFTVTRSSVTTGTTTVNLVYSGTATSGVDYTISSSSVTFAAGETTKTITVTPLDDSLTEGSETVVASIASDAGYLIDTGGSATVTFLDAPSSKTWNGAGADANWGTIANWAGGVAPINNDIVNFAGSTRLTNVNNLADDTSFTGLNFFNTTTGNFSLSGNRITLAGNITTAAATGPLADTSAIAMILSGDRTITTNTNHSLTLSGIISGAGGVTKEGDGTLILSAGSTFTGDVNINAGTVGLIGFRANATGAPASALGALNVARNINIAAGATLWLQSSSNMNDLLGGTTSQIAATLNINGGTLKVGNGTNAYAQTFNTVNLNGGTITLASTSATANANLNGNITVGGSAASTMTATSANRFALSNVSGNSRTTTFIVGDVVTGTDLTLSAPLVNGAGSATASNLVKTGAGTLVLAAVNTYTGNTTVSAGTLSLSNTCLADAGSVNLGTGATLDLNFSGTDTISKLLINGVAQYQGTWGSLTSSATNKTGYITGTGLLNATSGIIVPSITTVPTASAIIYGQTLASSTLTGGAASVAGTFAWTNPSAIPSATSAQAVTFTPTDSVNYATATTTTSVTVSVGSFTWNGGSATDANWTTGANWVGGTAPLANNLLVFAGTTRTTNINDLAADINFAGLSFTNTTAGQAFSLSGNRLGLGGDITLATAAGAITDSLSLPLSVSGNRTITANTNHHLTLSGNITGTGSLTKAGAGTLTLSGNNTFSGNFTLNGGSVTVSSPAALGTGVLGLSVTGSTVLNFTGGGNVANAINLGAGGTTIYAKQTDVTPVVFANAGSTAGTGTRSLELRGASVAANDFQNLITDGAGLTNFDKIGTGNWKLSNDSNSFTGLFAVYEGLLSITSLANAGSVSAAGAGTANPTIQMGQGNLGGILNYVGTGNSSSNRSVGIGAGTGNTANTGGATITNNGIGTLVFTATTFNPAVAGTTANRTLTLGGNHTGANGVQGTIQDNTVGTGVVALTKTDAGKWILSGNNTYAGTTTISGGTLQLARSASLYSGNTTSWTAANIKVATGATLALNVGGAGEFTTGNITTLLTNLGGGNGSSTTGFAAGATLALDTTNAAGGTLTIADIITNTSGTGGGVLSLTKLGANTLVLANNNTYSGNTTVSAGILSISTACLADAANVLINTSAVLDLSHSGTDTIGQLIIGGVAQYQGSWGGLASSAAHKTAAITGTGLLNVTDGPVETAITVTLLNLAQPYDGSPKVVNSTTAPVGGLAVSYTYNGSSAAPTSAGSYSVVATVTSPGFVGTASGTLVIVPAYEVWTSSYGLTGNAALAAGDPDGDGVANLLEYAFGTSPTASSDAYRPAVRVYTVASQSYLEITYRQNLDATDLTYAVQKSNDLVTWTTLTPAGGDITITPIASTRLLTVAVRTPLAGTRQFLRIGVTKN